MFFTRLLVASILLRGSCLAGYGFLGSADLASQRNCNAADGKCPWALWEPLRREWETTGSGEATRKGEMNLKIAIAQGGSWA